MRSLKTFGFLVFISGLVVAQTGAPSAVADPPNLADEIKTLREAITEQQKSMQKQQLQIAEQQQEIEILRTQVSAQAQPVSEKSAGASPRLLNTALTKIGGSDRAAEPNFDAAIQESKTKESPLSFRIGGADFTPGGFVDFENIFRTTNTGNAATTSFGVIPFSSIAAGPLTEFRATA